MVQKLKAAVVGLGSRIAHVASLLARAEPRVTLVGYSDPEPRGLRILRRRNVPIGPAYPDPEALLAAEKPDLVFIGSPNHLHLPHIELALASGAKVFSEKPVVRTEEETWALAALLGRYPADQLLVGLVLRSAPVVKRAGALAAEGRLGKIISMEMNEHLHPEHGAFLMKDWRRKQAFGGSFLLDKACHDFDLYGMLAGARVRKVASFSSRSIFTPQNAPTEPLVYRDEEAAPLYSTWPGGWNATDRVFDSDADVADNQVVAATYENGVHLTFHANSHSPFPQRRWQVMGLEAAMIVDLTNNVIAVGERTGGRPEIIELDQGEASEHFGADPAMVRDIIAHLFDGAAFPVGAYQAMVAGLTVMAIDRAAADGTVVDCAPLWRKLDGLYGPAAPAGI
jgi:predicted dehydrogenase